MLTRHWRFELGHEPGSGCEGWAIVFLDSQGTFAAVSDFGDWAYRWSPSGLAGRDIRAFLLEPDDDYLLRKLAPKKEYDGEATLRACRAFIVAERRRGDLDQDEARVMWDDLEAFHVEASEEDCWQWAESIGMGHEQALDLRQFGFDGQARAFVTRVMPRLRVLLERSLREDP